MKKSQRTRYYSEKKKKIIRIISLITACGSFSNFRCITLYPFKFCLQRINHIVCGAVTPLIFHLSNYVFGLYYSVFSMYILIWQNMYFLYTIQRTNLLDFEGYSYDLDLFQVSTRIIWLKAFNSFVAMYCFVDVSITLFPCTILSPFA